MNVFSLIVALFIAYFGAIIGSFLGVVIYRLPEGQSIVWGRSHCPYCKHDLQAADLFPILSYVVLAGKCRYCHHKLSPLYLIIELTTAAMFVLAYWMTIGTTTPLLFQSIASFIYLLLIFSLFVALFYIDLLFELLLDVLVFPALAISIIFHGIVLFGTKIGLPAAQNSHTTSLFMQNILQPNTTNILWGYGFGLLVALAFLLLIVITKGKGMGGGDVKYALVLGAVTGWPGSIVALFGAFVSGAIISLLLIAFGKKGFKQTIPFGPFLIGSTVFAMVYGDKVIDFYLRHILG